MHRPKPYTTSPKTDELDQLVGVFEASPDMGFMARLMALGSLPRTNPGNRKEYVRRNGPYALVMSATGLNKLPFGNQMRPATGLGLHRGGAHAVSRARPGPLAIGVHAHSGRQKRQRWC